MFRKLRSILCEFGCKSDGTPCGGKEEDKMETLLILKYNWTNGPLVMEPGQTKYARQNIYFNTDMYTMYTIMYILNQDDILFPVRIGVLHFTIFNFSP